ncbi:MAG: AraC family transcriptional regulator [Gammaproteobacteria bacterium]|nr:AraC family transcriptional regulator [Gammaproteobacteria bacterium]
MLQRSKPRRATPRDGTLAPGGMVQVGPLTSLPDILRDLGCDDAAPLFVRVGLEPTLLENPENRAPFAAVSRVLTECVAATGCDHLGLLLGQRVDPSSLGLAGFMLRSAPDTGTALRTLVQFLNLTDEGGVGVLETSGGVTLLGYAIYQPDTESIDVIYDMTTTFACRIMRLLCGEEWNPSEVLLARHPPRDAAPYRAFFRAPLRFRSEYNAVAFPTRWLNHRPPGADAMLFRHLQKQAEELQRRREPGLIEELHRALRAGLLNHGCAIGKIAARLGMHERSLHRRLRAEGTSFRRELDAVRFAVARQYLAESEASMAEIASAIDYADASAFTRAFKRWAGTTPQKWREQSRRN